MKRCWWWTLGCPSAGFLCGPQLTHHDVHRPAAAPAEQPAHQRAGPSAALDSAAQPQRWGGEWGLLLLLGSTTCLAPSSFTCGEERDSSGIVQQSSVRIYYFYLLAVVASIMYEFREKISNMSFSYFEFAVTLLNHRRASDHRLLIHVSSLSLTKCVLSNMVSAQCVHT